MYVVLRKSVGGVSCVELCWTLLQMCYQSILHTNMRKRHAKYSICLHLVLLQASMTQHRNKFTWIGSRLYPKHTYSL